jgi:hypothetical protein
MTRSALHIILGLGSILVGSATQSMANSFPPTLAGFLGPAAAGEVRSVSASVSIGNTTYYLIETVAEFEAGQMVLSEVGGKVTAIGADTFVFPLSRFKSLPPDAARILADGFVRSEIVRRGKQAILVELRHSDAARLIPPDLRAAYSRAGLLPAP